MDHKSKIPALRPRRRPASSVCAGEPSPLAPKIRVRYGKYILQKSDLQEISFQEDTFIQIQGFVVYTDALYRRHEGYLELRLENATL